jgi:anti-anti-sigma factor
MEVSEGRAGSATTLRIVGRVDSSVSQLLEQKVLEVMSREHRVVVDLRDVNYISSAGLRVFVIFAKHARSKNQTIALCGMQEDVAEVFQITGLLELFASYDTVEAAVAALS